MPKVSDGAMPRCAVDGAGGHRRPSTAIDGCPQAVRRSGVAAKRLWGRLWPSLALNFAFDLATVCLATEYDDERLLPTRLGSRLSGVAQGWPQRAKGWVYLCVFLLRAIRVWCENTSGVDVHTRQRLVDWRDERPGWEGGEERGWGEEIDPEVRTARDHVTHRWLRAVTDLINYPHSWDVRRKLQTRMRIANVRCEVLSTVCLTHAG